MTLLDFTPAPPDWTLDTAALWEAFAWLRPLDDCPQDAVFHAEGDVGTHLRMVLQELVALHIWRELPEAGRRIVFTAAVLHDIAKPACTRRQGDRITSHGHSARGAIEARKLLYEMEVDFDAREAICGLVRHHQLPLHGIDRPDIEKAIYRTSMTARCDWLSILAEADVRGRIAQDTTRLLDNIDIFREYCREKQCFNGPKQFRSDHSRFLYFRSDTRNPDYHAYDDTEFTAIIMSGLPGSGKDTWIDRHHSGSPKVSLDDIRRDQSVDASGKQGSVVAFANERARALLRKKQSFIWNATNLSRELRTRVIDLCAAYGARIEIVYLEAPTLLWRQRNESRQLAVPATVLERLLDRWEVPDLSEAHEVRYETSGRT